uniref:putative lipid-transfer protein DIR1 n=1 Tax=Erigeron canadensis TaxID=72917 RepID=UPI001CB8F89C|nr:putative lipid-transfer protein DIR1 [Erigeron canadensis]
MAGLSRADTLLGCVLIISLILSSSVCASTTAPASSTIVCNVEMTDLLECLPAITGARPPAPTRRCCKVMRRVNLPCLCRYKPQLAKFGANPVAAMAIPKRCGMKSTPKC